MNTIYINCEPVELYKILKFESMVYGGGEAKMVIAEGYVSVNGEIETQKRKKIYQGDTISFNGEEFTVARKEGVAAAVKPKPSATNNSPSEPAAVAAPKKVKRGKINF